MVNNMLLSSALLTLMLLLLSWPNHADAVQANYDASIQFNFPEYSSVHDCGNLIDRVSEEMWTQKECFDFLQSIYLSSKAQKNEAALKAYTESFGDFGDNPLFLMQARLMRCGMAECEKQGDVRVDPSDGWSTPKSESIEGGYLFYTPLATVNESYVLKIDGMERVSSSSKFTISWPHNYMIVRFAKDRPGHLLIEHDWQRTLIDQRNMKQVMGEMQFMVILWLVLMVVALPALLLVSAMNSTIRAQRRWKREEMLRALSGFGISLLLILLVMVSKVLTLAEIFLLYFGTLFFDCWWLRKSGRMEATEPLWLAISLKIVVLLVAITLMAAMLVTASVLELI